MVAVGSNGFEVRSSSGAPAEFAWPDALPVEVSVGDAVVVESSYDWTVLTLPRGQLVVSGEGNDEVRLLPGESAVVGEWSYGLVYAWVVGPEECVQGDALVISEGMGAGALVAYRSLDAAADRSGE